MFSQCHTFFALLILTAVGCKENIESVPATPPPDKPPEMAANASLRPYYQMGTMESAAGTAFIVQDKAGKLYMLTAAHIMDNDAEWQQVKGVSLRVMGGAVTARVQGRPVYIGKAFSEGNASTDLVIWPLAEGAKVTPLKLASGDPKKNEWLWAIGQEPGSTGPQKMYRCKVTGPDTGGFLLEQHDQFQMRGFSGGPVVNAQGEVVGSLLGGQGQKVIISGVSGIRARLAEAKIELP